MSEGGANNPNIGMQMVDNEILSTKNDDVVLPARLINSSKQ